MKTYYAPNVEVMDLVVEEPVAVSGNNEGFGSKDGIFELQNIPAKPF